MPDAWWSSPTPISFVSTQPVEGSEFLRRAFGDEVVEHFLVTARWEQFEYDRRITDCCSGHLDAARTAADAGARTLVLVHITEQLEQPGIRERVLLEAGRVFSGQIVFAQDLLTVPLDEIIPSRIR